MPLDPCPVVYRSLSQYNPRVMYRYSNWASLDMDGPGGDETFEPREEYEQAREYYDIAVLDENEDENDTTVETVHYTAPRA